MSTTSEYRVRLNTPLARVPTRRTPGSAGFDLYACEAHVIPGNGSHAIVDTGVAVAFDGAEAYCRVSRMSGLAKLDGMDVLPGIVDADAYPDSIKVIIVNHGTQDLHIEPGMCIAQLIFERTCRVSLLAAVT